MSEAKTKVELKRAVAAKRRPPQKAPVLKFMRHRDDVPARCVKCGSMFPEHTLWTGYDLDVHRFGCWLEASKIQEHLSVSPACHGADVEAIDESLLTPPPN